MIPSESHEMWMVFRPEIIQVGGHKSQGERVSLKTWKNIVAPPISAPP